LPAGKAGHSKGTAGDEPEEGGDDVKSVCPLCPGLHTRYNGWYRGERSREVERIPKATLSSDRRLKPACVKAESLVTADQPRCGEYVLGPCTHRPSRHESLQHLKSGEEPAEGGADDWGEVVTR
jgi:hypothetical protein